MTTSATETGNTNTAVTVPPGLTPSVSDPGVPLHAISEEASQKSGESTTDVVNADSIILNSESMGESKSDMGSNKNLKTVGNTDMCKSSINSTQIQKLNESRIVPFKGFNANSKSNLNLFSQSRSSVFSLSPQDLSLWVAITDSTARPTWNLYKPRVCCLFCVFLIILFGWSRMTDANFDRNSISGGNIVSTLTEGNNIPGEQVKALIYIVLVMIIDRILYTRSKIRDHYSFHEKRGKAKRSILVSATEVYDKTRMRGDKLKNSKKFTKKKFVASSDEDVLSSDEFSSDDFLSSGSGGESDCLSHLNQQRNTSARKSLKSRTKSKKKIVERDRIDQVPQSRFRATVTSARTGLGGTRRGKASNSGLTEPGSTTTVTKFVGDSDLNTVPNTTTTKSTLKSSNPLTLSTKAIEEENEAEKTRLMMSVFSRSSAGMVFVESPRQKALQAHMAAKLNDDLAWVSHSDTVSSASYQLNDRSSLKSGGNPKTESEMQDLKGAKFNRNGTKLGNNKSSNTNSKGKRRVGIIPLGVEIPEISSTCQDTKSISRTGPNLRGILRNRDEGTPLKFDKNGVMSLDLAKASSSRSARNFNESKTSKECTRDRRISLTNVTSALISYLGYLWPPNYYNNRLSSEDNPNPKKSSSKTQFYSGPSLSDANKTALFQRLMIVIQTLVLHWFVIMYSVLYCNSAPAGDAWNPFGFFFFGYYWGKTGAEESVENNLKVNPFSRLRESLSNFNQAHNLSNTYAGPGAGSVGTQFNHPPEIYTDTHFNQINVGNTHNLNESSQPGGPPSILPRPYLEQRPAPLRDNLMLVLGYLLYISYLIISCIQLKYDPKDFGQTSGGDLNSSSMGVGFSNCSTTSFAVNTVTNTSSSSGKSNSKSNSNSNKSNSSKNNSADSESSKSNSSTNFSEESLSANETPISALAYWSYWVFRAIPFLNECRILCDFVATSTCLNIYGWFLLDDAACNLYFTKADMQSRRQHGGANPRLYSEKVVSGFCFLLGIFILLLGPLAWWSTLNFFRYENLVTSGSLKLDLEIKDKGGMVRKVTLYQSSQADIVSCTHTDGVSSVTASSSENFNPFNTAVNSDSGDGPSAPPSPFQSSNCKSRFCSKFPQQIDFSQSDVQFEDFPSVSDQLWIATPYLKSTIHQMITGEENIKKLDSITFTMVHGFNRGSSGSDLSLVGNSGPGSGLAEGKSPKTFKYNTRKSNLNSGGGSKNGIVPNSESENLSMSDSMQSNNNSNLFNLVLNSSESDSSDAYWAAVSQLFSLKDAVELRERDELAKRKKSPLTQCPRVGGQFLEEGCDPGAQSLEDRELDELDSEEEAVPDDSVSDRFEQTHESVTNVGRHQYTNFNADIEFNELDLPENLIILRQLQKIFDPNRSAFENSRSLEPIVLRKFYHPYQNLSKGPVAFNLYPNPLSDWMLPAARDYYPEDEPFLRATEDVTLCLLVDGGPNLESKSGSVSNSIGNSISNNSESQGRDFPYWSLRREAHSSPPGVTNSVTVAPSSKPKDGIRFQSVSARLPKGSRASSSSSSTSDGGGYSTVIGLYSVIIFTIGRTIRYAFEYSSQRVIYTELEDTSFFDNIISGIYVARENGDLETEYTLWNQLIRTHRSPEMLIEYSKCRESRKLSLGDVTARVTQSRNIREDMLSM